MYRRETAQLTEEARARSPSLSAATCDAAAHVITQNASVYIQLSLLQASTMSLSNVGSIQFITLLLALKMQRSLR
jgi:hypothetical protein